MTFVPIIRFIEIEVTMQLTNRDFLKKTEFKQTIMAIKLILLTILIIGISFAGIAVKMFFKKGGEFRKSCSSVDPVTGTRLGCSCESEGKGSGSCRNGDE